METHTFTISPSEFAFGLITDLGLKLYYGVSPQTTWGQGVVDFAIAGLATVDWLFHLTPAIQLGISGDLVFVRRPEVVATVAPWLPGFGGTGISGNAGIALSFMP
jgi:hypothetical protein